MLNRGQNDKECTSINSSKPSAQKYLHSFTKRLNKFETGVSSAPVSFHMEKNCLLPPFTMEQLCRKFSWQNMLGTQSALDKVCLVTRLILDGAI
jgi:hypothetical protein